MYRYHRVCFIDFKKKFSAFLVNLMDSEQEKKQVLYRYAKHVYKDIFIHSFNKLTIAIISSYEI